MHSDDELQFLTPRMSIEYRDAFAFLSNGTFDNIPKDAFGAHIVASFPVVGADGKFRNFRTSYELYVGKVFKVEELLEQLYKNSEIIFVVSNTCSTPIDRLEEFNRKGIQNVVAIKNGILPLMDGDVAFATNEEMAAAITKINQTFNSVNISLQNAETQKMQR